MIVILITAETGSQLCVECRSVAVEKLPNNKTNEIMMQMANCKKNHYVMFGNVGREPSTGQGR